jgi:methionyl-tRNA synthetase
MSNQDIGQNEDTGSSENTNQAATKTYTQEEFDNHMARMKSSITKKYEKTFSELGDIDELRALKADAERKQLEDQKKRGEFDSILKDLAAKKDAEIAKRDQLIKEYTVDLPLVQTAAQLRAVNAEQVKQLLKPNVRLSQEGAVEIVDREGKIRYTDSGTPFKVEDLVSEFLQTNPHFVQPTPATTQSKSNVSQGQKQLDLTKLDMKNPEHRKMYQESRKQK